jgi:alpha-galactosidase
MSRYWRLEGAGQCLVLGAAAGQMPRVVYWGDPLPEAEDLATLDLMAARDVTGGMLDAHPPLSLCPEGGRAFPGQPGLLLRDAGGRVLHPRFAFEAAEEEAASLRLVSRDAALGLEHVAEIALDPVTGMLTLRARLRSEAPVILEWFAAPVLPGLAEAREMLDFSGRWIGEFQLCRSPWGPGIRMRESRTGRSGHEHFPALLVPAPGASNGAGRVQGFHLGWSGGHRMVAEELPDGRRQVQFGLAAGLEAAPGTEFETPPLYAVQSGAGFNGVARTFQRHLRDRVVTWPGAALPRPVHYNCWEAVYFDHRLEELKEIASRAADLGAERFVLDDGWFGRRDDDRRALGDWRVDARKYPEGLGPLIDHVEGLGMQFGLWLEPEMVNPESDLYRAHPDWVLGPADQVTGRQQLVLDMGREAVRDHLFDVIAALLEAHPIGYIKWDHNRLLPHPDAAQARGTYALLDRLRLAFPEVEIESCASGGGRIDFGILERTQRVWLSDSNDALERLRMQHEAALFLPAAVTGSHVGPRRCHTSGRVQEMGFRAWVAAQRHLGFEMDPRELTEAEAQTLRSVTGWWKANRHWLWGADILRLDSDDPALLAELQLAEDGSRFALFAGQAAASAQSVPRCLRLTGLVPEARYRVTLRNGAEAPALSRGAMILKEGPLVASGAALMQQGIALPWSFPERIWVLEGERE